MRTTIDIPDSLLSQACRLSGAKTKRLAVVMALQHLVDSKRVERLRRLRGKIQLDIDLKNLRSDRVARYNHK